MRDSLIRAAWSLASPGGRGARLSILIFHRVLAEPDPMFPSEMHARRFDALCGWLSRWARVLPLQQAVQQLRAGTLPARALAITFDDGYADNAAIALPLLQRHGLCATFFVATSFLNGGRMWNDDVVETLRRCPAAELDLGDLGLAGIARLPLGDWAQRRAGAGKVLGAIKYAGLAPRRQLAQAVAARAGVPLPDDLMMGDAQVRALRDGGMQIGAHTHQHPIIGQLAHAEALAEVRQSRQVLEGLLGEPVTVFAYPNGSPGRDYHAGTLAVLREAGVEVAVTTAWGAARPDVDPLQVPRFSPWDETPGRYGLRLLRNLAHPGERVAA